MKTIYIMLLSISIVFSSCGSDKLSNKKHIGTGIISDGLYSEVYKTYSGGTTTSNTYIFYMTDSIHFRKLIGKENYDNEKIIWNKVKDIIYVYKKTRITSFSEDIDTVKPINTEGKGIDEIIPITVIKYDSVLIGKYDINQLIKEGKFE